MTSESPSDSLSSPGAAAGAQVAIKPRRASLWRRLGVLLLLLVLLLAALAFGAWRYYQNWLGQPLVIPEGGYVYELAPGQSLGHLAADLARAGVLQHPELLRLYGRQRQAHKIHAGEYRFEFGSTPQMLLDKLLRGEVVLYQVTLVEGWTYRQALEALARQDGLRQQLPGKTLAQQRQLLGVDDENPEGWFFPDTYSFRRNTSDVELLQQAHQKMRYELDAAWAERADNLPYKTPYEALIMASIIERETGFHEERDKIAGVFVRRLQQGMKLQTDPTVIYGMGDAYNGKITRKDLQASTPYNTYTISGLPPTPISLPGRASLRAALNPAAGDALYFVAKGDGTSQFSATLAEHNAAVRRYQLQRRSDYRAAPPAQQPKVPRTDQEAAKPLN